MKNYYYNEENKKSEKNLITDFITEKTKLFFDNLKTKKSIDIKNKTLAIAYSSGVDSSVLFDTMLKLKDIYNIKIILLHVNYNLRGEDSVKDKLFAKETAKKNNSEIFIKETENKIFENKNTQILAREIRYNFFKKLHKEKIYDYLLTAQHKDDLIETLIFRMCKGSGTEIIKSMNSVNKYILRPFIDIYKKDISEYSKVNNIKYREDITNKKNKYKRNKIRNVIIPMLEEINTNTKDNIIDFCKLVYAETNPIRKKINKIFKHLIKDNNNSINIKELKKYSGTLQNKLIKKFLYLNKTEITKKRIEEIKKIIYSKRANIKIILDKKYLKKNYDCLYFSKIKKTENNNIDGENIIIEGDGVYKFFDISMEVKKIKNDENINLKDGKIYLSLEYPITIRSRKKGDYINSFPDAKKMKIKKLFIDKKIETEKRKSIPIIEKNNEIAAVCFNFSDEYKTSLNRISSTFQVDKNKTQYMLVINLKK